MALVVYDLKRGQLKRVVMKIGLNVGIIDGRGGFGLAVLDRIGRIGQRIPKYLVGANRLAGGDCERHRR